MEQKTPGQPALVSRMGPPYPNPWQSHLSLPVSAPHLYPPPLMLGCGSVPSAGAQGQINPVFIIVCCLSFGLLVL